MSNYYWNRNDECEPWQTGEELPTEKTREEMIKATGQSEKYLDGQLAQAGKAGHTRKHYLVPGTPHGSRFASVVH